MVSKGVTRSLLCFWLGIIPALLVSFVKAQPYERADSVYTDLKYAIPDMHAGIFERFIFPDENQFDRIIHVTCDDVARAVTFEQFQAGTTYRNSFTVNYTGLAYAERKAIIDKARLLIARQIPYLEHWWNAWDTYIVFTMTVEGNPLGSNGILDVEEIARMRCDALVEYSYALAGFAIIRLPDADGETIVTNPMLFQEAASEQNLRPSTQRNAMRRSVVDMPSVWLIDESGMVIDTATYSKSVSVGLNDPTSGVGGIKAWKGTPETLGQVLGEDFTPKDAVLHTYKPVFLKDLQIGKYTVGGWDMGGNWTHTTFAVCEHGHWTKLRIEAGGKVYSATYDGEKVVLPEDKLLPCGPASIRVEFSQPMKKPDVWIEDNHAVWDESSTDNVWKGKIVLPGGSATPLTVKIGGMQKCFDGEIEYDSDLVKAGFQPDVSNSVEISGEASVFSQPGGDIEIKYGADSNETILEFSKPVRKVSIKKIVLDGTVIGVIQAETTAVEPDSLGYSEEWNAKFTFDVGNCPGMKSPQSIKRSMTISWFDPCTNSTANGEFGIVATIDPKDCPQETAIETDFPDYEPPAPSKDLWADVNGDGIPDNIGPEGNKISDGEASSLILLSPGSRYKSYVVAPLGCTVEFKGTEGVSGVNVKFVKDPNDPTGQRMICVMEVSCDAKGSGFAIYAVFRDGTQIGELKLPIAISPICTTIDTEGLLDLEGKPVATNDWIAGDTYYFLKGQAPKEGGTVKIVNVTQDQSGKNIYVTNFIPVAGEIKDESCVGPFKQKVLIRKGRNYIFGLDNSSFKEICTAPLIVNADPSFVFPGVDKGESPMRVPLEYLSPWSSPGMQDEGVFTGLFDERAQVTARVLTPGGQVVRTLMRDSVIDSSDSISWDGENDSGRCHS